MNAEIQRHPVRGALWGLLFGIGLYFLAVGRKVVAVGTWVPLIILVLAGVALNVVWAMFGPAKRAKAPATAVATAPAGGLPPEPPLMAVEPAPTASTPLPPPAATATPAPAETPEFPPEPGPMT